MCLLIISTLLSENTSSKVGYHAIYAHLSTQPTCLERTNWVIAMLGPYDCEDMKMIVIIIIYIHISLCCSSRYYYVLVCPHTSRYFRCPEHSVTSYAPPTWHDFHLNYQSRFSPLCQQNRRDSQDKMHAFMTQTGERACTPKDFIQIYVVFKADDPTSIIAYC